MSEESRVMQRRLLTARTVLQIEKRRLIGTLPDYTRLLGLPHHGEVLVRASSHHADAQGYQHGKKDQSDRLFVL